MSAVHALANWQVVAASIIAIITFVWIITGLPHRTYAVLGGGLLMLLLGVVEVGAAARNYLSWHTIGLLIGLMMMVGITNRTGMIQYAAVRVAQWSRGKPSTVLIALALLSTVAAAWLDSLTAIILLIPVTISIARVMEMSAVPYVITLTITANLGGTVTLIGSLPNVIIGTRAELTFNDFLINLVPPVLIIWMVTVGLLSFFYAQSRNTSQMLIVELMLKSMKPDAYIKDKGFVIKVCTIWLLVLIAFVMHPLLRFELSYAALAGAALMSVINLKKQGWVEIYRSVDWSTLSFMCGLFVVVGGLVEAGMVQVIALKTMELTSGNLVYVSMLILWISGLVSATTDNTLWIALMIPIIQDLGIESQGALHPLWWSLALGVGIGGSGTLVGAAGNLIAAELASREGHPISFWTFMKAGAPLTIVSLLIATAYIRYVYY